ncbi:S16 family serine protease [Yinghuangia seranimata]|uniref:S16 family serine protease n=1 Tax=Yinghuangia seranimata TaxID=408067 RepID=UPI00248BA9D6|nr:S16 family serine protease [Yinghuangia seranimata]MDI2131394.1 hypothetical protein [Yinghuangia seranimata]
MARSKRTLVVSVLLVVILGVLGFTVPLPYTVITPGDTADTLGTVNGQPVIAVEGAVPQPTNGELLLTTIRAVDPDQKLYLTDLLDSWFNDDEAVRPKQAVYPADKSKKQIEAEVTKQMAESQSSAVTAAMAYLNAHYDDKYKKEPVTVTLHLDDVGGPSAGLMFSLGIVDKLGTVNLTGGKVVAGTGAIKDNGEVGEIGGVEMKVKAAKRDGATVFLLPKQECKAADPAAPEGLRLVPVESLTQAVDALTALQNGGKVPSC